MDEQQRPLRLLSLDGGGIRGLSILFILKSIMTVLYEKAGMPLNSPLYPSEYFDLIAGTSTGGLVAVMLGTLRMDIETCIQEYLAMAPQIFPGKKQFDPAPLEAAIKRLAKKNTDGRSTDGEHTNLRFEASTPNGSPKCKVFVCVTSEKLRNHFRFRSYESSWNVLDDCPIWQACRATSAAPTFFPPMLIGNPPTAYVDGGLGYNNPIRALLDEASHVWRNRKVGCIVSIGTGVLTLGDVGRSIKPLLKTLKAIATDTEQVAREFREEMKSKYGADQKIYFRFNVQHGLEAIGFEEWGEMDRTKIATQRYLQEVWSHVDTCASQLLQPDAHDDNTRDNFSIPFSLSQVAEIEFVGRDAELTTSKDEDTLKQSYLYMADRILESHSHVLYLKTASENKDLDQVVQRIKRWLNQSENKKWLLIYDNYDTPKLPGESNPTEYEIRRFLPESHQGAVLITTRSSRLEMATDDADAKTLLDKLDGLPLALATAGAYLRQIDT